MTSVIIIGDEDDMTDAWISSLKLRGLEIRGTCSNGKEVVELYNKHRPDVVLLNLNMYDYNGIFTIYHIKKINPNVKIILFSGSMDRLESLKNQVSYILLKPFGVDELVEAISEVIRYD